METGLLREEIERPPFDINRAVILAGFAFEAYTTPTVSCSTFCHKSIFIQSFRDSRVFFTCSLYQELQDCLLVRES